MIRKLPNELNEIFGAYEWEMATTGESGDKIYQINFKSGKSYFLKIAIGINQSNLENENNALTWIKNKFLAPSVIKLIKEDSATYLLTKALAGHDASKFSLLKISQVDLMKILAKTLRSIHLIPIDDCPLDQRPAIRISQAKLRWKSDLVDKGRFKKGERVLKTLDPCKELIKKSKLSEDLVFTHGDYCLANIIIGKNNSTGIIDLGRAGISDRYQDISLLFRSFEYYTSKKLEDIFLSEYGLIDSLDREKIAYYQFLDRFF